jgi:mono/diheme cytochrome c family protein
MTTHGCEGPSQGSSSFSGLVLAAACLLCLPASVAGQVSGQAKSVRDGVFTDAQADRGAKIFSQFCIACHKTERFVGDQLKPWLDQTADVLYRAIRLKMPEDNPGGLTRQQYADIVAYVFKLNGFKPGSDELAGNDEAMRGVRLEAPSP